MRWTTLATGILILVVIGLVRRRPDLAVVSAVAWAGGFEAAFGIVDTVYWHPGDVTRWIAEAWQAAALLGWVLLAYAVGIRPSAAWLAVSVVAFAVWLTTIPGLTNGFVYNAPQAGHNGPLLVLPEIENVVAKTAWAVAYAAGAWHAETEPFWRSALLTSAATRVRTGLGPAPARQRR
jgi:hypothetical protein